MFGEDDSESPRQPSPWQSASNASVVTSSLSIKPSSSNSLRPSTLAQFLESQLHGLGTDQGSWRDDIEPEVDANGHIEYKLRILAPTPARFEKLTTQLKWRLLEGGGTALYEIGVLDDGTLVGLVQQDMEESLSNLSQMANRLDAYIELAHVIELPEILIQTGPIQPDQAPIKKVPPLSQLSRPSSRSTTGGFDRKDRGRQKKKKKRSRSKSINSISAIVRSNMAKIRAAPGDSAVSSDSEPSTTNPSVTTGGLVQSQITLEILGECDGYDKSSLDPPRLQGLTSPKRWLRDDSRSQRQIDKLGGYLDQICLLTPEERSYLRRTAKKERRMKVAEERIRSKMPNLVIGSINPLPNNSEKDDSDGKRSEIKYVVEVKVLKRVKREEEFFLDFEGFGIG